MLRLQTISVIMVLVFTAGCISDTPQSVPQPKCDDGKCLPPEEPPAEISTEDPAITVAAEECLSCLGMTASACLDEYQDCSMSLGCRAWRECNDSCVITNEENSCYETCDLGVQDFYTPEKLKTCSCEVCYAQCFNMCPPE